MRWCMLTSDLKVFWLCLFIYVCSILFILRYHRICLQNSSIYYLINTFFLGRIPNPESRGWRRHLSGSSSSLAWVRNHIRFWYHGNNLRCVVVIIFNIFLIEKGCKDGIRKKTWRVLQVPNWDRFFGGLWRWVSSRHASRWAVWLEKHPWSYQDDGVFSILKLGFHLSLNMGIDFLRTFGSSYTYEKPKMVYIVYSKRSIEKRNKDLAILSIAGKAVFPLQLYNFTVHTWR